MTARVVSILLACLLLAPVVFAQTAVPGDYTDVSEMPGGIEGERIQMLFDAINTGDEVLAKQFYDEAFSESVKERFPFEDYMGFFEEFARTKADIAFHSIRVYDPPREDQTIIIYWDPVMETWEAFGFRYAEGEKPGGPLAGFSVNRARTPSDVEPEGPLTQKAFVAEVWPFLDRLCGRDLFSGTVLIARGDTVLAAASCGEASKRFHAMNNMDTKFNLGSMNKMFTSVAIMQLVEKGVLTVNDPISMYVDESWLPKEITDIVTIHDLLTHTSGLGSYFNETFMEGSRLRWRELDDYRDLVQGDTLAFEPGTDWSYSNTGMFMLGVVLESATGENYFDYIRENIYEPAGMENTDCYDMDCPIENLAIGYWKSPDCPGGWKNNYYEHVVRGGPAGGGFSTCPDLHRFARALLTGKLVSEASLQQLWTDHFEAGYGYGFGITEGPAGKVVGHNGGFTGLNSSLNIFLDTGYIVAVMSNYGGAADPVADRIQELLGRVE